MSESTGIRPSGFSTDYVYRGRLLSFRASTLDEYVEQGGGDALQIALECPPEDIVAMVKRSGLRGRGGAGFPTGAKWDALRGDTHSPKYFCCNGAEGEPGTFKDRFILRTNPYLLLEGMAIGAYAAGADAAFIAVKARFKQEIANLERAYAEMASRGLLGHIPISIKYGPDEYLFGEERALLEVIEGREPMPRILPPYMHGLLAGPTHPYPTIVNNVETISNVPGIVRHGADWFRSEGTEKSPGTMIFTLVGDVQRPGIYELPLGTPLSTLLDDFGGGPFEGRQLKAALSGASNPVMVPDHFGTPMDFDAMAEIGTGLGSGGFIVYDDSACMVKVAAIYSRFLHVESCAQCIPCKLHSETITGLLQAIDRGEGTDDHIARILRSCRMVTDGQRCYVPTAESLVVQSIVRVFVGELAAHLEMGCPLPRPIVLPKLVEFDETTGHFTFDEKYARKRPNWTYADEEVQP
ncbi:MAG TPA: NADH-ubiquinone oxidoreductase-F iron-sulfur binding region domain-containing protein [Actinomycetota bacterium]|jgi:NADH:ubiquinone oxidoreductase subunit F (NADH-binding)